MTSFFECFKVQGSYYNKHKESVFNLFCKSCECNFDVCLSLLLPQNCQHILNESVTIICPNCKQSFSLNQNDTEIFILETLKEHIQSKIDNYTAENELKFEVLDINFTPEFIIELECKICMTSFSVNIDKTKPCHISGSGKDLIVKLFECPHCHNVEMCDYARHEKRIQFIQYCDALEQIQYELNRLYSKKD